MSSQKIKIGQVIDLCMKNNFKYVSKPKNGVGTSSRPLLFFLIVEIKGVWFQGEKQNYIFQRFWTIPFLNIIFTKDCANRIGSFWQFTNFKKGSGTRLLYTFCA